MNAEKIELMSGKSIFVAASMVDEKKDREKEIFDWSNKTILIAEDEEVNFIYLQNALLKTKVNLLRANNGEEAVEMTRVNPAIDLILMDIKMPKMNGIEATRAIKSFRSELIIIAQTAFAMDEDKRNCYAVGVDDFLSKPVRYRVLIETINKHLK